MARYKDVHYDQDSLSPVSFGEQIQPGTFGYTQSYLIDDDRDLNLFDARYRNCEAGAPVTCVDVGGGLGVDYEGTASASACSNRPRPDRRRSLWRGDSTASPKSRSTSSTGR